jgi:hypothetical protein
LGGLGGLLRGSAPRASRGSAGINGRADLQAFRPLQTATLQTRIRANPKKPRRCAASGVFHGRLSTLSCTRFLWTPICPRRDRNDDVQHEEDRSSFIC